MIIKEINIVSTEFQDEILITITINRWVDQKTSNQRTGTESNDKGSFLFLFFKPVYSISYTGVSESLQQMYHKEGTGRWET